LYGGKRLQVSLENSGMPIFFSGLDVEYFC
jgi:hypothetical protein